MSECLESTTSDPSLGPVEHTGDHELRDRPCSPVTNDTIAAQLSHRSIRKYSEQEVSPQILSTLFEVARQTASSRAYQQMSVIHVQNRSLRDEIKNISGQQYVGGTNGELLIFVADQSRNVSIRESRNVSSQPFQSTPLFVAALQDTLLATQNVVVAAESLGLGTVLLGSIAANPRKLIQLLKLPAYTYPVIGLLVGYPDEEPQFKPRLPAKLTVGVDSYPHVDPHEREELMDEYDHRVEKYYDLRDPGKPIRGFTSQIASSVPGTASTDIVDLPAIWREQGFNLW